MLDINKIREDQEGIRAALLKRMDPEKLDLDSILKIDDQRRKLLQEVEILKAERNKYSKTKPDQETIVKMKKVGEQIKEFDEQVKATENNLREKLAELPNIPAEDVLPGGKENNKVIKVVGQKPEFDFEPKDHYELATSLGIIDYERAAKMSGTGFWVYRGDGAILEWALLSYFLEFHRGNHYIFMIPPFLLTEQSAYTSGHLPKFRDDLFWTQDQTCLNATSEMMLGNYHRDEILDAEELPIKYAAYSACFRREAGSYRKEERGMIRGHQFNKIEMFHYTKPEQSWDSFDELVSNAEKLVEGLGLHFQTVQLAAGDASAAMAKTMDVEVWIPSMNIYKEVSSVSNALDYQARRGNVRFKDKESGKNEFVHTLNASGLATSRLFPAILEQFQNADGSVSIPKALQKYTGFKKIEPKK
ncbi:MAG: serine--tRNA ligase [Patescibacteria group bacterium]|jgi:seryl-tRNA synthetase|nr:serine--tRNA ligase [Patescibacteria group bacterium]